MEAVIVRDGDIAPSLLLGAMPFFLQVGVVKSNGDKLMQLTSWAPFVSENQLSDGSSPRDVLEAALSRADP
jgi:hypothetical protein